MRTIAFASALRASCAVLIGVSFSSSVFADDEKLKVLTQRDNSFHNYRLKAAVVIGQFVPGEDAKNQSLRRDDSSANTGPAHWERLQAEIETNTVGDSWKVTSTGTSTVTYSNGENEPIVSEGLVIFKKPDPAPVSANLGVVAGLHPVMGLGLSQLVDCSWTQSGGSPVLKGRNVERGMVTAVFRQDALLELKSLQLSIKPNFLLTYSFEPYQSIGNVRVPTKVRLVVSSGSREFSRSEYTISDVALGVAKLPANQSWFLPGNVFVDERLERPVSYQYSELLKLNGGSTEITAERLLEFSKRKMIRDMYAEPPRNTDRGNSYLIPALVVLIACVAGLGIAIARKKS